MADETLISLTADIVTSYVANNSASPQDLPALISAVHASLNSLGKEEPAPAARPEPAVSIRASVKPDYIVCLEDGKKLKTLKRHLMTLYGMTPAEYRTRWSLPADYPMVAPEYAARRSALAKSIGLGRVAGSGQSAANKMSAAVAKPAPAPAPAKAAAAAKAPAGAKPASGAKRGRPAKIKTEPQPA